MARVESLTTAEAETRTLSTNASQHHFENAIRQPYLASKRFKLVFKMVSDTFLGQHKVACHKSVRICEVKSLLEVCARDASDESGALMPDQIVIRIGKSKQS
jgi:hypothetical protein